MLVVVAIAALLRVEMDQTLEAITF